MAGVAAFLYHETRSTTLYADQWQWVFLRRDGDVGDFLEPHNQHLSLVPVAIYKLLFATAGLDDYVPYRGMAIAGHLGCVALLFVYARRRVGPFLAVLAAALLLFLGPAWEDILWPFQIAWLISLAAGLGALLMLDRRDRAGDLTACLLVALSLASSGLGVSVALGAAVDVLWGRRRWRDLWIVAAPLALYAVWWLIYQESDPLGAVLDVPRAVLDGAASALSAMLGLAGDTIARGDGRGEGTLLRWGRPLAAVAFGLAVWRVGRLGRVPPRALALLAAVLSFWVLTEISRGRFTEPTLSRYIYVGALFIVLVAVELARGVRVRWPVGLLLAAAVAGAATANLSNFRDAGRYLRSQSELVRADLGALEVARPVVEDDFFVNGIPRFPINVIAPGPYFSTTEALGTPAMSVGQLRGAPPVVRMQADATLASAHEIALGRSSSAARLGARPAVDDARGVAGSGPCVVVGPTESRQALDVVAPPAGLLLRAAGGPAEVGVRRFADSFRDVGRVSPSATATLRIRRDRAPVPWHVRIAPTHRATVCGLRR